jgi:outer membrane protein OmpA-like peptidoglycan-associated protein/opacity protein-like surface antigen
MKKIVKLLTIFLLATTVIQAQAVKNSWSLGFGGSVLNHSSTDIQIKVLKSFGGYLTLQRNFTEHTGLRLGLDFASIVGAPIANTNVDITTTSLSGRLDLIYNFMPCESFSPFMTIGVGQNYYSVDNLADPTKSDVSDAVALQIGISLGAEANLSENWKLKAEIGSYQISRNDFDGSVGSEGYGVLGANSDAFLKMDLGLNWYFSKGEQSKICQLYDGIQQQDLVDYERVEEIVKKYIPREVIKEVVVEKEVIRETKNNQIILLGVNYEFNSNRLKPEAYPILFHTANVMKQNPELIIEIQGYTDNIGSEKANKIVSQKRAESVENYLIARGISEDRVKAIGYGEANPIGDNKDAAGRAMNRRIEFKILD